MDLELKDLRPGRRHCSCGRSHVPTCQALHDEVRAQGFWASLIAMDLGSSENCEAIVQPAIATFDHVDALVNNAAINDKVGLEHGSAQEFMCSLERNLLHYYIMAFYSVPHLKRPRGSICQRRFENGAHRSGRSSGYLASKPGIFGITRECATVAALQHSGERGRPCRSRDPALSATAPGLAPAEEKLKSVVTKIPSTGE
jgi:L-fucose dehydrogenase